MNHLFVPYEIALQLKEKGFDEFCIGLLMKKVFNMMVKYIVFLFIILLQKKEQLTQV